MEELEGPKRRNNGKRERVGGKGNSKREVKSSRRKNRKN
jgi:hypothetical protein